MVRRFTPSDGPEAFCPACGAAFRIPGAKRRVQCPKCREIVTVELHAEPQSRHPVPPRPPGEAPAAVDNARLDALENRIAALEGALKEALSAARGARTSTGTAGGLHWFSRPEGASSVIPPAQSQALVYNLSTLPRQAITIRFATGDIAAKARAEWFRAVFERAKWLVRGPEEIASGAAESELSLAVSDLPVAKEAAATYLALKAAGFDVTPVLDPGFIEAGEGRGRPLALILASAKAA
jgi:hypothetical protein